MLLGAAWWTACSGFIGCQSGTAAPAVSRGAYAGPPLTLEGTVVVMTAPSPGYQIVLDRVSEAYGRKDVFVSVRKPDPRFSYPAKQVTQRVGTGVAEDTKVTVYARLLRHDEAERSGVVYGPAAAR